MKMKKRVVISKSALVGMLILGTTFPSTWPIAQATETQQTKQQTPSIDSSVPLLADSTGSMDTGETSSVLLSVTGILFLIGGLVFLYRKKSLRKQQ